MNSTTSRTQNPVTVSASGGRIIGLAADDGSREFLGIRFATADRFQAPVDVVSWEAPIEAFSYGPICHQVPGLLEQMLGTESGDMSEDCLSLNIFTPGRPIEGEKKPVLFWIHGGAFTNGSGSLSWYHGGRLAARGTVVVTINYRLGALGYLGDSNCGTLDQISALRWVQRNIAAFGGDPSNVTIFGESAGGSAVVSLLASPDAHGLFRSAWAMSPSINQLRGPDRASEVTGHFLTRLNVSSIEEASTLPVEDILAAQSDVLAMPSEHYDIFSPVAGGAGLAPDLLGEAARNDVPLVIGTTRDENRLFSAFDPAASAATADAWAEFARTIFGDRADEAAKAYESRRPGDSAAQLVSAVRTDIAFRQPARRLAEARAAAARPTWMYWFTWSTPAFGGVLGSCHALDIPFAFDNLGAPGADMFTGESPQRTAVADTFAGEIVALATHAHPSWAQFDTDHRRTLRIDTKCELLDDPEGDIRALFT